MNYYYFERGLDVIEHLAKQFKDRQWWLPDFICDDVLDTVFTHVNDHVYYTTKEDFGWEATLKDNKPKVFFAITYFGKELILGSTPPPNTITVRDSIWMPKPFAPVEGHQIWFNSYRKIIRGARGASVVTPFRLRNVQEVSSMSNHPLLTWDEINARWNNFFALAEFFPYENQVMYTPEFPTVFPVKLTNRDYVVNNVGFSLPGMWKNKYKFTNRLYKDLTFIPVDSRFDKDELLGLAERMLKLDKGDAR